MQKTVTLECTHAFSVSKGWVKEHKAHHTPPKYECPTCSVIGKVLSIRVPRP